MEVVEAIFSGLFFSLFGFMFFFENAGMAGFSGGYFWYFQLYGE